MKIAKKGFLEGFSLFELILLALLAAAGIAAKPVAVAASHLVAGPLAIPGGALAGGFYMLFVVLGGALVGKRGSATLVCAVQGIIVLVTGVYGSHGAASLVTYTAPGILVDLLWLIMHTTGGTMLACFFGGITANVGGTFAVNLVFFRMPFVPLMLTAAVAALSGGMGGIVAWQIVKHLKKPNIFSHQNGIN